MIKQEEIKKVRRSYRKQTFLKRSLKILKKSVLKYYKRLIKPKPLHLVRNIAISTLILFVVASYALNGFNARAASYTWNQTDWSGGLSGGSYPVHPTNQTGWTQYESKDASTSIGSGSISVSATSTSNTQTSQADFNAGTLSNVSTTAGGDVNLTASAAGDVWTAKTNVPVAPYFGQIAIGPGTDGKIYLIEQGQFSGDSSYRAFGQYSTAGNSWSKPGDPGGMLSSNEGQAIIAVSNVAYIFPGGATHGFKVQISPYSYLGANSSSYPSSASAGLGVSVAYPGTGDYIYMLSGNSTKSFWRYSISGDSFTSLANTTVNQGTGAKIVSDGGNYLYAITGSGTGFYRYSISGTSWSTLTPVPVSISSGDGMVYPGSGDYIYVGVSGTLYRYSISGTTWTTMAAAAPTLTNASDFAYPGSGNFFYAEAGSDGIGKFYAYTINSTYNSSGTLTSSAIDLGQASLPTTLNWTATTPTNTTLKFQIRSATTSGGLASATYYGPTGTGDYYTSSGTTINSVNSGFRYYQYKAFLDTTDTTVTPTLSDVTLNYNYYPSSSTLTSSAFNANDAHNVLAKIIWTATTPTNTAVKFQLRSAPNSGGVPGSYTSFMGPDGTSATFFTDNTGSQAFPSALTDSSNDQWFQYKVFLTTSDNLNAPTLSDVTTTYVVNAPPDFNPDYPSTGNGGVGAVENSDGTVTINYSVRDTDTATGATPNTILPTFEYSLDNGSTWSTIISGNLSAGNLSAQSVGSSSYTVHTATWNAVGNVPGTYASQVKIRVTANDSEAANNTASAISSAFALDTKTPTLGTVPIYVNESQSPAVVTLSATDDSTLQMKVGKVSDLSDATYEAYASTKNLSVSPGQSVYVQFKDAYGNTSSIVSAVPPSTPSNMFFQDVSNSALSDWRIFFAWSVISNPTAGFKRYNIYRSTDGGSFSLLTTITSRATNYYVDAGLITTSNYTYKVAAEDNNGNISFYSPTVSHTPDGVGGSDITPPTLSAVTSSNVTTSGATIAWTTDKLSNSTVYYAASPSYPGSNKTLYTSSIGVPSMVTSHSVTLTGLTSGTQYYFLVESTDASSNIGNSSQVGYTFTTSSGPVISNVTAPTIFDNEATISWKTDIPGDSQVTYSIHPDMSSPTNTAGDSTSSVNHSVTITGLNNGTKYYYYVSTTDVSSNTATDKNVISGVVNYYSFVTTNDTSPPVISNVATSLVGENGVAISWTTDKPSLSQVNWGTTSDVGTLTTETIVYTFDHQVVLTGLSDTKEYFYKVISKDKNNNTAQSDVNNFTTLAPTVVTVGAGGSGGAQLDNRDLSVPIISNVQVLQITAHSAIISFSTSKITNGLVNFGTTQAYGSTVGDPGTYSASHRVVLVGLNSLTLYHFLVQANDIYKNQGTTTDSTFTTLAGPSNDPKNNSNIKVSTLPVDEQGILSKVKTASPAFSEQLLVSLSQNPNLVNVPDDSLAQFVSDFASTVGASPAISGPDIVVETGPHSAIIRWTTDKPSNSLVAYAKSSDYNPSADNPYTISAGFPDLSVTEHSVTLPNLDPNTTYHFNARSQGTIGPVSVSGDKTFQTTSLFPIINNLHFNNIDETDISVSWQTDVPTSSHIVLTNNATGAKTPIDDPSFTKDHTTVIPKLDIATPYTMALTGTDSDGNNSKPSIVPFTTVLSKEAPKILNVHVSTTLIPDQTQSAQTIISWKTDKPATSKVFFAEGAVANLTQSTPTEGSLVEDHIIVTTQLKPGTAYTLKIESGDSAGNITDSGRYSILTPKVSGSVVDLIFGNFNKTFGFLK